MAVHIKGAKGAVIVRDMRKSDKRSSLKDSASKPHIIWKALVAAL